MPRIEPYASGANRPYVVFGQRYVPDTTGQPYRKQGIASWYGKKFHGNSTSIGEPYDMYAMTAAHTTLPVPSYARVTSLVNGRTVIVRVNDRGPFHSDRIMDLSYVAAYKLGIIGRAAARWWWRASARRKSGVWPRKAPPPRRRNRRPPRARSRWPSRSPRPRSR